MKSLIHLICSICSRSLLVSCIALSAQTVSAQQPDAGSLMQEAEPDAIPETNIIPDLPARVQPPTDVGGTSLPVNEFVFNGNTVFDDAALQQVASPWLGQQLTLAQLKHVTDLIAERYRDRGYLVRVYLPEQNINDGSVQVEVVEALFGKVIIDEQSDQLGKRPDLVEGIMTSRHQAGELFNLQDTERAALLVNDLPGIGAKAVLAAGEEQRHTDIKLSVVDAEARKSYASIDNHGSRSTGRERLILSSSWANPFERGDKVDASFMLSEGNRYAKVGYDLPVGYEGLRIGSSLSLLSYELGGDFEDLDAEGSASNLGVYATYPLVRLSQRNMRLSGGLLLRNYENEQLGEQTSDKSVTAVNVGISGDIVDGYSGGGVYYYGANLILGDLDLSGNRTNYILDQSSARTDGSYVKLAWNVARLQYINDDMNLWVSAKGQFADNNLDSSETINLGGAQGVRAYPTLEASGDEGLIMTAELRYGFNENWSFKGFVDYGQITQKSTLTTSSESHDLKGYGVSADWSVPQQRVTARITLATRIGDNPLADDDGKDTDGTKHDYPVWVNFTKQF